VIANLLVANCAHQDCGIHDDNDKLKIDVLDNEEKQTNCVKSIIQSNQDKWHKAEVILGTGNDDTTTELTEKKIHDMLNAIDGIDVLTLNLEDVKLKDDDDNKGDGIKLDSLRVLKINLRTENDCHTTTKLLQKLSTKDLRKMVMNTNTKCEPEGSINHATKCDKLDDLRLTSDNTEIQSNDEKCILAKTKPSKKFGDDELEGLKKVTDRHAGNLRELKVLCGNDADKLKHLLKDNKDTLRTIDINLDLRKIDDDTTCPKLKDLTLGGNDLNENTLDKIGKLFPNTEKLCIHNNEELTDDEKTKIENPLKNLKRTTQCRKI
jgi:hypothetical protein